MKTRDELIQLQQELLNRISNEQREFTPEEQAEFNDYQRQIDAINAAASGEGQPETATPGNEGERAINAERQRCADITTLCRQFGVEDNVLNGYISDGISVDGVREAILNKLAADSAPIAQRSGLNVITDEQDKFRDAASDALLMRSGMNLEKPAEGARELMHMSLRDMYIESECMRDASRYNLMRTDIDELYNEAARQFYNPTAAFPAILDNAINKSFTEGYKKVPATYERFTKKGSLKDFKTVDNKYLTGTAGVFLEVPENGELKADTRTDTKLPSRRLKTYGRQFSLSRQAFINDDIGLITELPARYAASARKTINKMVYEILVNNPAVYDGQKLFCDNHKNELKTGSGITLESLQKMIMALQTQKDQNGESIIVNPGALVVPSGMAFSVYTLFNSSTINTTDNTQAANPLAAYKNKIEIIEDPTINALVGDWGNAMPWFLFGNNNDVDSIEIDYLNGNDKPTIRRMEKPGVLGFTWDVYLDWGITVMDYRGIVKNKGAVISSPLE